LSKLIQEPLQARERAIYSMVKSATRLVSNPNQTWGEIEWNVGTVSIIVTMADMTIKNVMRTCTRNADGEDVGCSSNAWRFRLQRGYMFASTLRVSS
jgi:hypothetical protein